MNTQAIPGEPHRTRLWALFARDAPKAVILRRGPRKHFHLIKWDLRDDSFTHGQWMKGFVRLWDLSPNGEKIIYWAYQYHASAPWRDKEWPTLDQTGLALLYDPLQTRPRTGSQKKRSRRKTPRYQRGLEQEHRSNPPLRPNCGCWTAVSTPPYFSALAIWPSFGHWTGGGTFASDNEIVLQESCDGMTPRENVPIPARVRVRAQQNYGSPHARVNFSAWQPMATAFERDEHDAVAKSLKAAGMMNVDWIKPPTTSDLLFACDGRVYRLENWRKVKPDHYLAAADLLADLTGLSFEMVRAPSEAMRW